MFCSQCGTGVKDGAHFCDNCGATLQAPGGVSQIPPGGHRGTNKAKDPYREQISQLKLQIRQLKLNLKQINTEMGKIRSQYNQSAAFVPRGMFRRGYKEIEDARLWGPQQKKQELQQQIMYLEQQLLGLQQQQTQWQAQQSG
jgi:predicted amidophosphoribosyltransferase